MPNQVLKEPPSVAKTNKRGTHILCCTDCSSAKLSSLEGETEVALTIRALVYGWKRNKCPTCIARQFNRAKL